MFSASDDIMMARALDRFSMPRLLLLLVLLVAGCGPAVDADQHRGVLRRVEPVSEIPVLPASTALDYVDDDRTVHLAPGEYEPLSFVLRSNDQPLEGATIEVGIEGPGDIEVDTHWVKVWYQGEGAWVSRLNRPRSYRLTPELLLRDPTVVQVDTDARINRACFHHGGVERCENISTVVREVDEPIIRSAIQFPIRDSDELQPIDIAAGRTQQLWLTLHADAAALPGLHWVTVTLKHAGGSEHRRVPVQVLPFGLPESPLHYALYYRGRLGPRATISADHKSPTQYLAEMRDLRAHGVTNVTSYQSPGDLELFAEHLRLRAQAGVNRGPFLSLGLRATGAEDRAALARLEARIAQVDELARAQGFERTLVYGREEVRGRELDEQREVMQRLKRAGSGVFIAGYEGTIERIGDVLALFVRAGETHRRHADAAHEKGALIYSYNNPQGGVENPEIYRRNFGIDLYRKGYDGAMTYAYQTNDGFIWNDWDRSRFRDHVFAYPTIDGVIPTIAWEGFREAVDDVRYFHAHERALDVARGCGCISGSELARAAAVEGGIRNGALGDLAEVRATLVESLLLLWRSGVRWDGRLEARGGAAGA